MEIADQKKKAIADFCTEMSSSMTRAEGERDFQREAVKNIAEQYQIDKKMLKRIARIYHTGKFSSTQEENTELENTYTTIFGDAA
jgi:hypothetical protein